MPRRRRRKDSAPRKFVSLVAPLRLGLERLEDRLLLSSTPAADYDRVSPAWFAALPAASPAPVESDPWIVRLTPAAVSQAGDVAGAARLLANLPVKVIRGLGLPGQLLISGRGVTSAAVGEALAASPLVATFQRDARLGGAVLPNDPDINNGVHATALSQYALYNTGQAGGTADADIDADLAWDITTGSASVVTAVIDTGIFYTHPDLAANAWTNPGETPGDGLDNDGNGFIDDVHGWDFVNGDNAPLDDHGHGTHVAGAIGAVGNNGLGVTGVNWTTRLMALKFLDRNNVGSVVNAVAAINYATMMRSMHGVNVRVINASWGGAGVDDPALRAAIAAAGAADILFVAAAGNGDVFGRGQNIDELPFYPASFNLDNILVVGASDRNDNLATFSNYGPNTVDIVAPGLSVWNTNLFVDGPLNAPTYAASYGVRSGTSMAAPLVAGTAALAWASAPLATAGEIRDAILAGGDGYHPVDRPNLLALQGKIASGKRLNARGALVSLPPQARVTSALDVTSTNLGQTTYQFTVELASNAGITAASVGSGDFLVRRKGTTGADLTAMLVSAAPVSTVTQWTGTYQITPPGGSWDVLDHGSYEIVLVAGQLVDVNGVVSRQKAVDEFAVNMDGAYVYRPTVFTDSGPGSLREAITLANAVTPEQNPAGGTVLLAAGTYTLSLAGAGEDANATGDLDITGKVTVASDGSGPVEIIANGMERAFDVLAGATFQLSGVNFQQGSVAPSTVTENGGGLRNAGTATLTGVEIADFEAVRGGAVFNTGLLTIIDSDLLENSAMEQGGAIYNAGTLTVEESTIDGNSSVQGGGVWNANGHTATITDSTISQNDADGPFTQLFEPPVVYDPTPGATYQIATADVDGDGDADFLTANYDDDSVTVFTNNGAGDFTPTVIPGVGNGPVSITIHPDLTGDQNPDVLISFDPATALRILPSDGNGNFSVGGSYVDFGATTNRLRLADLNGDGVQDIVAANFAPSIGVGVILVQPGQAPVVKTYAAGSNTSDIAIGHLNNDQILDVVAISVYSQDVAVLLGEASGPGNYALGSPSNISSGDNGGSVNLADFNGDEKLDLAYAKYYAGTLGVRLGNGNGTFQSEVAYQTLPGTANVLSGDFDRDGAMDLLVTTFLSPAKAIVLLGHGDGTFQPKLEFDAGVEQSYHALADFNNDHWLDAAVGNRDVGSVSILLNTGQFSPDGGGVYNAGTLTATNVTISGNDAANQGGGVYNADSAQATIESTTITANSSAGAGAEPVVFSGDEFRVSGWNASGAKRYPEVVGNGKGRAFVVYESDQTTAYESYGRFIAEGDTTGGEFSISDSGAGVSTLRPGSVMNGNGDIITVSQSNDGANTYVEGRFHNAVTDNGAGSSGSGIFSVTAGQTNSGADARVALNDAGKAVIVWLYDAGGAWRVRARRLTNFAFDGGSFPVGFNSPYGIGLYPDVAIDQQGNFAIVWGAQHAGDAHPWVYLSLYAPDGSPISENIRVSAAGTYAFNPRIERDEYGMTIAWQYDQGGSGFKAYARRYDNSGNPRTGEFALGSNPAKKTETPRLTLLNDGGFFAVWTSSGAGDVGYEIRGQRFSANGARIGTELQINQFTAGDQFAASVGQVDEDTLLVAWGGNGATDSSGIFGRFIDIRYDAAGIANASEGVATLRNTIVADNASAFGDVDVDGAFLSGGGNVIGNVAGATGLINGANGNKVGSGAAPVDPKLGPLSENGGPTKTHLPAADSPAIDAGVASGAPATDQRGVDRPKDGDNNGAAAIDIGAVERYYASISGKKFKDQNQNGVQDGGELGLPGWTMYLDLNQNNQLDVGEPSTGTDAQGNYKFAQLAPGTYTVAEISPPGWVRTYTSTLYLEELVDASSGALGLAGASSMAATADGKFVYVAGAAEAKIQRFSRDAVTGQLTPLGTTTSSDQVGGVNVLQSVVKLVVAPVATTSGLFLYALSAEGALTIFSVNPSTGALTQVDVVQNGQNRGTTVARMVGATGLAVSPDGNRVYVSNFSANALNGGSLLIFERVVGQSPELRLRRILSNGAAGASPYGAGGRGVVAYGNHVYIVGETADASDTLATYALAAAPAYLSYVSVHRNGQGGVSGLDGANDVAVSADGKFLYVSAATSGAVTVFARDGATGALTFLESLAEGAADGAGNIVAGVQDASSVALSDDGSRVYVTGRKYFADLDLSVGAVAVFQRNATTGRLTFLHALADSVPDALGAPIENLEYAADAFAYGDFAYVISGPDENALTTFRRDGEGRDRRTLLVGQDLAGVNFSSFAPPAEIRGTTYNDLDNDGARDLDENVLGGVAVYLDLNGNDSYDNGEPTVTTSPQGQYAFADLTAPAVYAVRVIAATNQNVTFPPAADNREWTVALAPNEIRAGVDFMIHGALSGQGQREISGRVWQDLNGDGVRQESEPYLIGRSVYLDANDNGVYNPGIDLLTTTGAEGLYTFTTLGSSTFVVRVLTVAGESTSAFVGNAFVDQKLPTGAQPLGLVSADFNGDGKVDLATIDQNADQVSVLLQQAGGGFAGRAEHRVGSQPTGVIVGRFNNDALPDIAVVHWSLSRVVFLINQSGSPGTFVRAATATEINVPSGYTSIAAADIDLDGDDDLAVAIDGGSGADVVQIWRNNNGAVPTFAMLSQHALNNAAPLSIAAGDLTGDGRADFVLGNFVGDSVQVLRNNPGTSFTLLDPVSVPDGPASVFIAPDMNGDGHKDVVTANIGGNGKATILAGDGLGGLTKIAEIDTGAGPRTVAVADVDNDGDLDLLIGKVSQAQTNNVNDVVVLRRQGPGLVFSFPESTGQASFASLGEAGVKHVLVAMLDGDAVPDIAAVRGDASTGSLTVLYNAIASGARRVDLVTATSASNQDFGITTAGPTHPGDYDGDQDRDGHDFLVWQHALGSSANPPGSGADGDASGAVGGGDLTVWRNHFGQAPAVAAASLAAVPTAPADFTDDDRPESRDAITAREAFYAAGDFTHMFAEVRSRRPARRVRFGLVRA